MTNQDRNNLKLILTRILELRRGKPVYLSDLRSLFKIYFKHKLLYHDKELSENPSQFRTNPSQLEMF